MAEKEKKKEKSDYPSERKKAVSDAKKELSNKKYQEGPTASAEETGSPDIKKRRLVLPETKIVGDPHAAEGREQSAELEAATGALEDQQNRRLQNSMSNEVWDDATGVAEAFGIPVGLLAAGYGVTKAGIADLIGTKEVVSAADPVTAAYKPPTVTDVVEAGHKKADLPSGIKPGGMEGAGTLKGQALDESARLSKEAHKIVGGADPRSAGWKKRAAFEKAVGAGTAAEEALEQVGDMGTVFEGGPYGKTESKIQGYKGTRVGTRSHPVDWQADTMSLEYQDPKWRLHAAQDEAAERVAKGTAPSSVLEQKKYLQGKPAYGVSPPKGTHPAAFQTYKNLTAQAKELLKPISKTMGFMSPWLAGLAAVTGAYGVSSLVLDQLGEADSEAIPTTMRVLSRLNESPLKADDVVPEALQQLTPEDVESLHQDGTISYQLYKQLQD